MLMSQSAHLHEKLRQEFEVALPLESVVQHLLDFRQPGVKTTLLEQTSDHATLSMEATIEGQASHIMTIRLQRWQGTDTRAQLYGEILTPPPPIRITRAVVAALTVMALGIALWVAFNLLPPPISDDIDAIIFCFGSLGLLAAVMGTGISSNAILVRDWFAKRRWRDQQALAGLARHIESHLKQSAAEASLTADDSERLFLTNDMDTEHYAGDVEA